MSNGSRPAELHHGGRLRAAARRYGIAPDDWLDLSTGINPSGWPVPAVPASAWVRLPEDGDGLEEAARAYYGVGMLPVAGSQAAIQALPRLRSPSRVRVLHPGYVEHAHRWRQAGHTVVPVAAEDIDDAVPEADVVMLSHPNNPTGARFPPDQLFEWQEQLAGRGGWMVVDEAFIDSTPEHSLCRGAPRPGLVVLRSLGKFFGLAGARVGFVCAQENLLAGLKAALGPWTIGAPARFVAAEALADSDWQQATRERLHEDGARLRSLLERHGLAPDGGCALFQWTRAPDAAFLNEALARQGVLTRLFDDPPSLRFGLPGDEPQWRRLDDVLARVLDESRETGS